MLRTYHLSTEIERKMLYYYTKYANSQECTSLNFEPKTYLELEHRSHIDSSTITGYPMNGGTLSKFG